MQKQLKNKWLYVKIFWMINFLTSDFYRLGLKLIKEIYKYWRAYNQIVGGAFKKFFNLILSPIDNLFKKLP